METWQLILIPTGIIMGFILYKMFATKSTPVEVEQIAKKPKIRDNNRLGGTFLVEKIKPINDDKAMFLFDNGFTIQYNYDELKPVSMFGMFNNNPEWEVVNGRTRADITKESNINWKDKVERLKREKDFEHRRAIYLESNEQQEVNKQINNFIKLERSKEASKVVEKRV